MHRPISAFGGSALLSTVLIVLLSSSGIGQVKGAKGKEAKLKRGAYLANYGGCTDCHSPKVMTPMGPMPDTTRLYSGHPENEPPAPVPAGLLAPDKWMAATNSHLSAWVGPWGISFARNLTPDTLTGLGSWTEAMFVNTMRTGKHMGEGRDLLPPMPWQSVAYLTDEDIKALWAYLRTVKPIENAVPDPISPTGEKIPTPGHKH